jgi:hypothetical protein
MQLAMMLKSDVHTGKCEQLFISDWGTLRSTDGDEMTTRFTSTAAHSHDQKPFDVTSIRFDTSEDLLNAAIEGSIATPGEGCDPLRPIYQYEVTLAEDLAERIGIGPHIHVTMWDWKVYSVGAMMSDKNASDGKPRSIMASAMAMSEEDRRWFSADVASWAIAQIAGRLDYLTDVIAGHDPNPGRRPPGWHPNDERQTGSAKRMRLEA